MPPGPRLDGLSVAEGNKTGNPRAWIPRWQCLLACPVLAVLFWEPSWLQFLALDEQPGMEKEGKKKRISLESSSWSSGGSRNQTEMVPVRSALRAQGPLTTKLALFLLPHPLGWGLQPLNLEEVNSCSPNWPVCSHQLLFLCLSFSSW